VVDGMFVRLVIEIRREGVVLPANTIIRLPTKLAAALIKHGLAVPERTDMPSYEAETR
jgi:hypothetical protein